jgi:hypothetical protein
MSHKKTDEEAKNPDVNENRKMKRKTAHEIMRDVDPDAKEFSLQRFFTLINEILESCNMVTGMIPNEVEDNFVEILSKMEDKIHYLCEARNHLNWKDKILKGSHRDTLEKFEVDI